MCYLFRPKFFFQLLHLIFGGSDIVGNYGGIASNSSHTPGSGKTTTLVEMTRRNPQVHFLLVVFNRSVADHSSRTFPTNVVARTANSLAYRYVVQTFGAQAFGKRDIIWYHGKVPALNVFFQEPFATEATLHFLNQHKTLNFYGYPPYVTYFNNGSFSLKPYF
jgi:hypothetical protein